jgi:uncharacterized Zn finger protein
MADLKTQCAQCANNIVVAEILTKDADADATYLCHACQKIHA